MSERTIAPSKDWLAWHAPYEDAGSPLSRRLRIIQAHIDAWLDECAGEHVRVVSACAGQGHDLLGVLTERPDSARVRAVLVENNARNVEAARRTIEAADLANIEVRLADAGDPASYEGALPADLLLTAGVFGNVSDEDVRRTVAALPGFCAANGVVIWTRSRREPDLTPAIRGWFRDAGFVEEAFHAPDDVLFSVGVHRLANSSPDRAPLPGRLFQFLV